jgi:ribosome-binding factor A
MTIDRLTRVNELLKREIAAMLFRVVGEEGFDVSAVTVTHVEVSSNLRHARVYISIRDHEEDRGTMMRILRSKARGLQQHLRKTITLKYIPGLSFHTDDSIRSGARVLELLDKMERDGTAPPYDEPPDNDEPPPEIR